MKISPFLSTASAALLIAAAGTRSNAQGNTEYPLAPGNVAQQVSTTAPSRAGARTAGPASLAPPEGTAESRRKSWRDLPHSKSEGKTEKPSTTFSPWSAAGALAVVVVLILVLARLFRRHAPLFQQSLPQEALEILGRRCVDPRQTILLVRIGARILVVGSSANGLNPLGQIDDPVEVDLLAGLCRRGPQTGILGTPFFKLLKGASGSRTARPALHSSVEARQTAAHRPTPDAATSSQSLEPPTEGLPTPEFDLMRRLRGAPASLHADTMEGVR